MDLQVQRDFRVPKVPLGGAVQMGIKADVAHQEHRKYKVHLVSVVTWEIQVLEGKGGPPLLGPQALPGHQE